MFFQRLNLPEKVIQIVQVWACGMRDGLRQFKTKLKIATVYRLLPLCYRFIIRRTVKGGIALNGIKYTGITSQSGWGIVEIDVVPAWKRPGW